MSTVQEYFAGLDEIARIAFDQIRLVALEVAPAAVEGVSYGMAALLYRDRPLLGFRAAKAHLSVFPFSPTALASVADRLTGFALAKGTIRFTAEMPIPDDVVRDLVQARKAEIDDSK